MHLTQKQKEIGKMNFNEAAGFTRRSFLKGAAAAVPSLGAVYFGYEKLQGDPVRVGFIGTGDEGNILITQHPPEYMDIVAVADIRPTNRKRAFTGDGNEHRVGLVKKLGEEKASQIQTFDDHRQLIEAKDRLGLEAVVIAVPLNQHAPIAREAMNAGLHVFSEKLMAKTVKECKEMLRTARKNKVLLGVGHQRHYSVLYDNATSILRSDLLGTIKHIRASWHRNNSYPNRDSWVDTIPPEDRQALSSQQLREYGYDTIERLVNWRLYNATGGGLMAELGSHHLDACSIFLGALAGYSRDEHINPIAVQGFGGKNYYGVTWKGEEGQMQGLGPKDKWTDPRDIDDHVYVTYEFPGPHYQQSNDDVVIYTFSSMNTNRLEPYGERIFGSRASLLLLQEQEALLFKEPTPGADPGGLEQRLHVIQGKGGQPVLDASESLAPTTQASQAASTTGEKISRGYTEEMEHFCHCIRTGNLGPPSKGGLRCNGHVGLADTVMALTANLAMQSQKRIVFKPEWFDPEDPSVPEEDPDVLA